MAEVEFGLLGPLVVRRDGIALFVAAGRQRALLAALLLNAGRVVPADELIEVLWDDAPPVSARASLHNYVRRLRKVLGDDGHRRISTGPHGYMISVEPAGLDVDRFQALAGAARAAARAGSWEAAAAQLRDALALWRGAPLADVDSQTLALREVPRLEEMRLQALEARIDADLHLGRHAEVITELRHLADRHPLRENLHGQLMLALYRGGRQAEALAAYQSARRLIIDELGTEPGTTLRELHQRILTADAQVAYRDPSLPAPDGAAADGAVPDGAVPDGAVPDVPRELPARVRHFTGRAAELAALTALLDRPGGEMPETVVISAIGGTAGVGKTALAVHWAHQVAERFPDGQLYVNLRGYDQDQPMTAADALAGFLRALGVPSRDIPTEEAKQAARYRSLLAARRVLIVLDNAGSADQVRPLLPGSPTCAVVVTSRDSLAGLMARDGAERLDLDLLPLEDAVGLLRTLIGPRAGADLDAVSALAVHCCRLPLALRVAAELASIRAAMPLSTLAAELTDQQKRLDLLDAGGDTRTAVRAVFSWSYLHLDAGTARTFRLLGLHPGADFDLYAAAALTCSPTAGQGSRKLDALIRAHFVQPSDRGRYGIHDLLRAYSRELAAVEDTAEERRTALTRLFDYYLHTAAAAMNTLFPSERDRRPVVPASVNPSPPVAEAAAARAWLDTELTTLVAVVAYTTEHGWLSHTIDLAGTLFRYLETGGHYSEATAIQACARRAAREAGDRTAEAGALNRLSAFDSRVGRYQQAADHLEQALALWREVGDRLGEARSLNNLGNVDFQQGRCQEATGHLQQALALYRQVGDRAGEALALGNLAYADERLGRYQQATDHLQQALVLCRKTGNTTGEAHTLDNLGVVAQRLGRFQEASDHLQQALALFRETGNRDGEAQTLANLGEVLLEQDCHQQAIPPLQRALTLFREIGGKSGEARALNGLGEACLLADRHGDGRTQHIAALALASQIGDKHQQARAHDGLGHSYHATGDSDQAFQHWQQALALYTALGVPEADRIRAQLTTAGNP